MTHRVAVVTDSTADLPPERCQALRINVVPLTVHLDGDAYEDGTELSPHAFYEKLATVSTIPTTSQPAAGRFQELFESLDAEEIVSIHISSKLSGTCNSARAGADSVPKKRIAVLDSQGVSLALGYLVQVAAEAAAAGAGLDEVCALVAAKTRDAGFFAVLDTLHHARRSGRIGFAQALLGSMLQVRPIIGLRDGAIEPVDRPRTMRKGLDRLVQLTAEAAPFEFLGVPHANNEPLANETAERLADIYPGKIDVVCTGAVIGAHCGPGAVATCFLKKGARGQGLGVR